MTTSWNWCDGWIAFVLVVSWWSQSHRNCILSWQVVLSQCGQFCTNGTLHLHLEFSALWFNYRNSSRKTVPFIILACLSTWFCSLPCLVWQVWCLLHQRLSSVQWCWWCQHNKLFCIYPRYNKQLLYGSFWISAFIFASNIPILHSIPTFTQEKHVLYDWRPFTFLVIPGCHPKTFSL